MLLSISTFGYGFWGLGKGSSESCEGGVTINGLVGTFPAKIGIVMEMLRKASSMDAKNGDFLPTRNRILLYGPYGNGKSTLARKIAAETNSAFCSMSGPEITDKYIGEGARKIKSFFDRARTYAEKNRCPVVIFIDEIDAIAIDAVGEDRIERSAILEALWLELDSIKDDCSFLVIGATNKFKEINRTFLDRFGSYTIEIGNPDEKTRLELLDFYWAKYIPCQVCDKELFKKIARSSEGLSARSIENIVEDSVLCAFIKKLEKPDVNIFWENLNTIKERVNGTAKDCALKTLKKAGEVTLEVGKYLGVGVSALTIAVLYFQTCKILKCDDKLSSERALMAAHITNIA